MQGAQVGEGNGASPAATGATGTATTRSHVNGGRFDFDDGGTYCGGWEEGKAHGHGVCTGPKGQGAYSGSWHYGFEVSGVYTWPSGSCFEGQWQNGKRHGLGVETRGRWIYRGEWTQGFKGRYGVRQSNTSTAKYEGTWANGLQDGYGSETYADDGTYQGQWMRGMRHGYGIRKSAPFGKASKYRANKALRASLTSLRSNEGQSATNPEPSDKRDRRVDDSRGGFVLKMNSAEPTVRRRSLGSSKKGLFTGIKLKKQRSTGDLEKRGESGSMRSTGSSASWVSTDSAQSAMTNASQPSESNASFVIEDETMDPSVTETYMGEWKNDKRSGYGISERSDGLRYEGEWYANKKYGYGVTTFSNGEKEEGKYKNNVLITSQKKKLFLMRSAKFRERIDAAVNAAQRASKIALQKSDIAINRTATARGKAEQADIAAAHAREDSDIAEAVAKQYAPDFKQPGLERLKGRRDKYLEMQKYNQDLMQIELEKKGNPNPSSVNPGINSIENTIPNHTLPNNIGNKPLGPNIPNQNPYQQPHNNASYQQNYQQNLQPNLQQNYQQNLQPNLQQNYQQNLQQNYQQNLQQNYQQSYQQEQTKLHQQNDQLNFQQEQAKLQQKNYQQNYQQDQTKLQQKNYQQNYQQDQTKLQQKNYQPNYQQEQQKLPNNPAYGWKAPANAAENNPGNEYPTGINRQRPSLSVEGENNPGVAPRRRVSADRPYLGNIGSQSSKEYLEQYSRPPSVDPALGSNSRDTRYAKATARLTNAMNSRQPSVDRTSATLRPSETPDRSLRAPSAVRGTTPAPIVNSVGARNGSVVTGGANKAVTGSVAGGNPSPVKPPPFEDIILRKRGLGQDIVPSQNQPKRTESLFIPGQTNPHAAKISTNQNLVTQNTLQRKKSLPDVQDLPRSTGAMSREEVSYLGSARREEIRRQHDEYERLRANPLLYLVSPQVKDWFSRQQLVLVVLFINISLAIMFFKLLT